jgi:hypothetical protein
MCYYLILSDSSLTWRQCSYDYRPSDEREIDDVITSDERGIDDVITSDEREFVVDHLFWAAKDLAMYLTFRTCYIRGVFVSRFSKFKHFARSNLCEAGIYSLAV